MDPFSFLWIFVLGIVVAFAGGFSIGANDVANSFSTSVGSKSLTLKQACTIAVFTEFGGAFLFGQRTTETIRGKIINVELFSDRPDLLMLGMVCALFGAAAWVIFATSRGWPVSTTHSIIGAIMGVGIAAFGMKAVDWSYESGVASIITSWLISPLIASVVASAIFLATKYFVLMHQDTSFQRGLVAVPIYFGITIAINVLFLITNGVTSLNLDKVPAVIIGPIVVGITLVTSAFAYFFYAQWLRRKILGKESNLKWYHIFVIPFIGPRYEDSDSIEMGERNPTKDTIDENSLDSIQNEKKSFFKRFLSKFGDLLQRGVEQEVADYKAHETQEMHDSAVRFDKDTEKLYSFLQIITGAFASFAHGSNDVSNAIGPLATIYLIYTTGEVDPSGLSSVPLWLMALGGAAIDAGLLFYGYHVMRSLGNQITYHSPSRGFSMELGTSLTVLTASKVGFPISTTHCITGATAGVGLCNGKWKALNWRLLAWCFFSWALTLPAAAIVSGSLYAFAIHSPRI
ncbi:hypothetical protein RirG_046040 [Rhizophagus irregularis DAOM 197198w]|uniref:Phosphate transporter n=3 Tax=Rhizophagus irregularis TaxID=588596 RepID=A0A015JZM4_RHIIW|nr:hypothetical protein RirG_046040 [Rhizophagus irregularis DAOM 197198w]